MASIRKAPELGHNVCIKTYANGSKQVGPCPASLTMHSATGDVTSNKKFIFAGVGLLAGGALGHFVIKKGMMYTAISAIALGAVGFFVGNRM